MGQLWMGFLAAVVSAAAAPGFAIEVEQGGWGGPSAPDIEKVLVSVATVLLPDFPQHASLRVRVAPSRHGPRVLFEGAEHGSYVVLLNVQGRRWDQFVYQFSH